MSEVETAYAKCPTCDGRGHFETGDMVKGCGGLGFETVDCADCDGGAIYAEDHDTFGYPFGTEVELRGEKRVVFYEHEGDHVIIWWFPGDEATHGPPEATEAETNAIYEQLWRELEDHWAWQADD